MKGFPLLSWVTPALFARLHAILMRWLPHSFSGPVQVGTPNPAHAQSVIDVIYRAVKLVQTGHALAICTSPIYKKALQSAAGFAFPGHTEYLAHLADVKNVVMMLVSPMLRVVPATIHIALREVTYSVLM